MFFSPVRQISCLHSPILAIIVLTLLISLGSLRPANAITWIPGEEITSSTHHLIALNVWSHTSAKLSLQSQIWGVRAKGGQTILPHPYKTSGAPGFSITTIKSLRGFLGVELTKLVNNEDYPTKYYGWDYGGTNSPLWTQYYGWHHQKMWGFRNPDIHSLSEPASMQMSNVTFSLYNTRWRIMNSLKRGSFYSFRSGQPVSTWIMKSFPRPWVNYTKRTVNITVAPGYSARVYSASPTARYVTCSFYQDESTLRITRDVCAHDRYPVTLSYKVRGGEGYLKLVVTKYTDRDSYPSAQYNPIYVSMAGDITYNPYSGLGGTRKYVGSIHVHTNRSSDAPKGASPYATLRWFGSKGFDWISITDHNTVTKF